MEGLSKKRRPYWLLIAVVPFVPALLTSVRSYLQSRIENGNADWGDVIFTFFDWLVLGLLTPLIYILARYYPVRQKGIGRAVAAHVFGAFGLGLCWTAFGVLLGWLLSRFPGEGNLLHGYLVWLIISFPMSIFLYVLLLGCVYAFTYYHEARESESQQARLAAQLAEARLSALRMQLNPHFLFNSLNAITVLVRDENTRDASQMLELLSDVLHEVLQSKKQPEITLNEEIEFIEKYLAIEQVRFSDRLRVRFSIEATLRDALVPEFILQPLVENAIRHGISQQIREGEIQLAAGEEEGDLVLSVQDNGPGYRPTEGSGLGLANTRERLETLYGAHGQLQVSTAEGGGTIAVLRFPLKKQTDE